MAFEYADCPHKAIENPVGAMSNFYRKPDQVIEPYQYSKLDYGEEYVTKRTCLWLHGLPPLLRTNEYPKPNNAELYGRFSSGKAKTWEEQHHGASTRSKTFLGIAKAMADQWGLYVEEEIAKEQNNGIQ